MFALDLQVASCLRLPVRVESASSINDPICLKARLIYVLSAAGSISPSANPGTSSDQSVCGIPQILLAIITDGVETANVAGCLAQQGSKVCSLLRALLEFKGSR